MVLSICRVVMVCRHPGGVDWIPNHIKGGYSVTDNLNHVDEDFIDSLEAGDIVAGILPIDLAARVCDKGAKFYNLSMNLPAEARGKELSADDMSKYGARLEQYAIKPING